MKKTLAFVATSLFLGWLLLPIPLPGQVGAYNPFSGLLWCSDHSSCVHEVAHKLDQNGGMISHSIDFGLAVRTYLVGELAKPEPDGLAIKILRIPGVISFAGYFRDDMSEIYAKIFEDADGRKENTSEAFRKFYDWKEAEQLLDKYQKYPQNKENILGSSEVAQ